MRRNGDLFPVRREQEWGVTPWAETGFLTPSFFGQSPWQAMRRMQEDMDRVFGQLLGAGAPQQAGAPVQQWTPSVDVSQDEKEWLIEVDLPGVNRDAIDVQVYNNHLVLRAELRQGTETPAEGEGQERRYHRRERRYGYFERVVPLPQSVDEEQIRCEFQNGVLKVHLPRLPEARPRGRRIPIGEGQAQPSLQGEAPGTRSVEPPADAERRAAGSKGGERAARGK
jgi:HSP20 family protein